MHVDLKTTGELRIFCDVCGIECNGKDAGLSDFTINIDYGSEDECFCSFCSGGGGIRTG